LRKDENDLNGEEDVKSVSAIFDQKMKWSVRTWMEADNPSFGRESILNFFTKSRWCPDSRWAGHGSAIPILVRSMSCHQWDDLVTGMGLVTGNEGRSPRKSFHGSGPEGRIVSKEFTKRRRNALSLWADGAQQHAKNSLRQWPINHQRHKHKAIGIMIARWIAYPDRAMQSYHTGSRETLRNSWTEWSFLSEYDEEMSTQYRVIHRKNLFTYTSWFNVTIFPEFLSWYKK
jgi:hypothetical protein